MPLEKSSASACKRAAKAEGRYRSCFHVRTSFTPSFCRKKLFAIKVFRQVLQKAFSGAILKLQKNPQIISANGENRFVGCRGGCRTLFGEEEMAVKSRRNSHYRNYNGIRPIVQVGMLVGLRPKIVSRAMGSLSDERHRKVSFFGALSWGGCFSFSFEHKRNEDFLP